MNRPVSSDLLAVARTLAIDAACGEVVTACRAGGIEPVLLKGVTLAEWLYPDSVRYYCDADLLVPPGTVLRAAEVLAQLGFTPVEQHVSVHAHPWLRLSDHAEVDLHATFWPIHHPAEWVWAELQPWLEWRTVAGVPVRALSLPARALHVVLHAAQHPDERRAEDLRRALQRTPPEAWLQAQLLADRLGALTEMAAGLELERAGAELITRLPLVEATMVAQRDDAPLAVGMTRFFAASGVRPKLGVVWASLTRPPGELSGQGEHAPPPDARFLRLRYLSYLTRRFVRTVCALRRRGLGDRAGR